MSELIGRWQAWFIETLEGNGANFITAERDGENWNFRRFTRDPQAATIAQLQAELAEAREVPGRIVEWLRGAYMEDDALCVWDELIPAIEARDWSKP